MSGDATPNLDLVYLDASQAQPEVKINDAWNKIDAAVAGLEGVTVADADSPFTSVSNVKTIRIAGGSVAAESGNAVLVTIDGGNTPANQSVGGGRGRDGDDGRRGRPGAGIQGAQGAQGSPGFGRALGAYFTVPGGGALGLPVNAVEALVNGGPCSILEVLILTKGGPGSCTVKLWKANFASHYPPVVTDDITGGTNISISSGTTYQNGVLSGWTTSLAADDVILITLSATSSFTSVAVYLRVG